MKNIPNNLKEELKEKYPIDIAKIIRVEESTDGTKKYLFEF